MVVMYIAAGYIEFDTSDCGTLKERRSVINSIINKTLAKFSRISINEVGNSEAIDRAVIGVTAVSNDKKIAESILSKVLMYIENESFRTVLKMESDVFTL